MQSCAAIKRSGSRRPAHERRSPAFCALFGEEFFFRFRLSTGFAPTVHSFSTMTRATRHVNILRGKMQHHPTMVAAIRCILALVLFAAGAAQAAAADEGTLFRVYLTDGSSLV